MADNAVAESPEPRRPPAPRWAVDALVLGAIAAIALSFYVAFSSRFVLDCDVTNLAMSIGRFTVLEHQPHPPGYLGYVLLLKLTSALTHLPPLDVPRLVSRVFALSTIVVTWRAVRRLAPERPNAALWAAALAAANPILLYYGVDGQTHSAEATMGAALLWALADPAAVATRRRAVVIGLLLAAGGSLRPSFALLSVLPVLWVYRRDLRALFVVGIIGALGTAAWVVPTIVLSGGWAPFRRANAALFGNFVRITSVLSSEHDVRYTTLNVRDTAAWTVLALGIVGLAALLQRAAKVHRSPETRRALVLLALMVGPALPFYFFVYCAEAGYLSGFVPPAAAAAALLCRQTPRWLRATPLALCAAELAFFLFGPEAIGRTYMLPDASEVVQREFRIAWLFDQLEAGARKGDRVLVLSDYPDPTQIRQFPLLRGGTDVLFFHDPARFALGKEKFISFATDRAWKAAPPVVLESQGNPDELRTQAHYDQFVLDPRSSDGFRHMLQEQTACIIAPRDDRMTLQHLGPECFRSPLRLDRFRFLFADRSS